LLYAAILGLGRIENIQSLQINGVFKKIMGIKKIPDPTAMRRFLYRLTPSAIRQIVRVHNLIQKKIFLTLHTKTSVTFDIDGTVLTVYGKQQRAKVGYNPKKRGRKSYCLMLCFESNREFWYGSLRPGNISQVRVSPGIIKKCLAKLPYPIYRVRIRGDSAFYSHTLIEDSLEKERIGYVIEARIKGQMWDYVERTRYNRYKGDWETAEFYYQPQRCNRSHRFVVQRRPLPEDPEERLQLKLFERKDYGYRVCITNLKLKPGKIWDFYSQRSQGAEQNIKELKWNYPLTKIPTQSYTANIAYLQLLLFAFNIVNWFKRLCLPKELRYKTLQTIRQDFISIPARLIRSGDRNILKFPTAYPDQKLFCRVVKKIQNLKI